MDPAFVSDSIGDEEDEEEEEEDEESPSSPSTSNDVAGDDPATTPTQPRQPPQQQRRNRYDEQKQRDWKTFLRFLDNRKPRLTLSRVRSPHVMEFLESIDSFGKTLVHETACPFFGRPDPPSPPCACPLRQSWGSLDALVGRLRASCDEAPARPETNPFGVRAVRNFLLRVKDAQATARGIPYSRKRKSRIGTEPVDASAATVSFPSQTDLLECSASAPEEAAANPCFSAPIGEEEYGEQPGGTHDASPGDVPFLGSDGQDGPVPLQVCWVRPPVTENQSTPPFYPIWRYPAMQSLVPFLPPFPYMPLPTPQKEKEKDMRIPKPEAQMAEDHPSEGPSSSNDDLTQASAEHPTAPSQQRNRYEEQKKRDWNTFLRFLENREPRLTLSRVRSPHVMEFLKSIDQFGKTLVHESGCPYFGNPNPAAPCACPLRQSWGSLDALVGRLRASCEESPNRPETNPFGVRAVRNYLLLVKDNQATARGIPYSRKRKRNLPTTDILPIQTDSGEVVANAGGESTATLAAVSSSYLEAEESGAFHADDSSTYQEESASTYLMLKESSSASSL